MADQPGPELMGIRMVDKGKKNEYLEVVVLAKNLKKNRDTVVIDNWPQNRSDPLVIKVNGEIFCNRPLYGVDINKDESSLKVNWGKKAEIIVKLKKTEAGKCVEKGRLSPPRKQELQEDNSTVMST